MASNNRPDHEIHAQYKRRMKVLVTSVLWLAFTLYAAILFPEGAFPNLASELGPVWLGVIKGATGGSILGPLLAIIFFSSDSAFRGRGQLAKWTQSIRPSTACARITNLSSGDATAVWFRYFDTWALQGSHNQALLQNTYSATYTARMVYHLTRACVVLSVLSVATMAMNLWVFQTYQRIQDAWPHIILTAIYFAGGLWLWMTNRSGVRGPATGAWERVEEVFARSVSLLKSEVLDGVTTMAEALAKVDAIRQKCSTPPR